MTEAEPAPAQTRPRFSVVIALYNKQDFIRRTVESVLAQSFRDFDVLIVDDGSSDASLDTLGDIRDDRLQILQQPNAGKGAARSRGIDESKGEWIALLDADDYWFPDHLAELSRVIETVPAAGMIATDYLEGEDSSATQPLQPPSVIREVDYFKEAAGRIGVICSSAVAVRRDVAERAGAFGNARTGEDLEYWARAALLAPVALSSRVTAYYLRNDQSIMAQTHRTAGQRPPPQSLAEAWPSVAFLETVMDRPEFAGKRGSILAYIRKAAYLSAAGHLARGEIAAARHLIRFRPGKRLDRLEAMAALLHLPEGAIRLSLGICARLRSRSTI